MLFFFFNDTATTEIYTLSLHDALPISDMRQVEDLPGLVQVAGADEAAALGEEQPHGHTPDQELRSEEHTSELQSQSNLVCRLLLEKKKRQQRYHALLRLKKTRSSWL